MAKLLWTQKQNIGPRPRAGHALVYDSARQRIILFGGSVSGARFGDTWEWDGNHWTQVQDIGPAPRSFHAMAFDTTRNQSVLFGGGGESGPLGDTWEWDGENWTQVADSGPGARFGHAMAFDTNRQRIVLFGGQSDSRLNDTWEWDGTEWVQQDDSGPSPRMFAAMAFDPTRNRVVLFGGAGPDNAGLGDTWEWDGTAWTEEAQFGADPCVGTAMAFKTVRTALFGGASSLPPGSTPPQLFGRSWEWDGVHWTARQDIGPGPRVFPAMAFDAARERVVLFGGSFKLDSTTFDADVRGDTWEQFEPGQSAVDVAAVDAVPNPAQPGVTVTVTAQLTAPAPTNVNIDLLADLKPLATISIAQQATEGTFQMPIAADRPPGTISLTARLGRGLATTTLVIQAGDQIDVGSVSASPNPARSGQTVTVMVTIAAPAPENTAIALLVDGQPLTALSIGGGATTGTVSLPVPLVSRDTTVELTARSTTSEASTALEVLP